MRKGKAVTVYLSEQASEALDRAVEKRADADRNAGLTGYAVTNRSKLVSSIVEEYLMEWEGDRMTIAKISTTIIPILKSFGVKRAELFGSYARDEQSSGSDIDLLVDEGEAVGLRFFKLQNELSQALGRQVHLQSVNGASDAFLEKVAADRLLIYAS